MYLRFFLLNQKGTVRLLFQPAEEGGAGAFHMIKEGALGESEAIFGMHVQSDIATGEVKTISGPAMAATSTFSVRMSGKPSAFSSWETHSSIDPVLAASSTILALQHIVSTEADPLSSHVCCILCIYVFPRLNLNDAKSWCFFFGFRCCLLHL